MMKRLMLMLLLAATWMGVQAAVTVEKTYMLKDFSGLKVSGDIKVHYTQGNTYEVRITTDERKLDKLVVEVRGTDLVVGYKPKTSLRGNMEDTHLYLTCPKMERIVNSGACSFTTEGFTVDRLQIKASGATSLQLGTVHCETADIENSGATKMFGTLVAQQVEMGNSGATNGELKVEADYFDLGNEHDLRVQGQAHRRGLQRSGQCKSGGGLSGTEGTKLGCGQYGHYGQCR